MTNICHMWQIEIKIRHNFQIPILSSLYKFIIYRTNIGTGFVQIDSIDRRLSDLFNTDSKEQSSETQIFVFVHNTNSFT